MQYKYEVLRKLGSFKQSKEIHDKLHHLISHKYIGLEMANNYSNISNKKIIE